MKKIMVILIMATALFGFATQGFCLEDTVANRKAQADRYLKAVPPVELFQEMTEALSAQVPAESRAMFKATMNKNLDIAAVTKATYDAMVKHFNADELNALADFYGSPVGKSAMKKFPDYMAEVMPTLQDELEKAVEKTTKQFEEAK